MHDVIVETPRLLLRRWRPEDLAPFAREGDPIAAALMANGIRTFRHTARYHEPRGLFCGIGQCTDCVMEVDGKPNVKTCITRVREGMTVRTQEGNGGSAS
mgnify:CR=1 FL=1